MLVQLLRKKMDERHGWLSAADLEEVARLGNVPLYRVEELISFFPHFRRTAPPPILVQVCRDMACHLRGARDLVRDLGRMARPGAVQVEEVSCLGRCDRAPAICVSRHGPNPIHEHVYAGNSSLEPADCRKRLEGLVEKIVRGETPPPDTDAGHRKPDGCDTWNINVYGRRRTESADGIVAWPTREPFGAVKKLLKACRAARDLAAAEGFVGTTFAPAKVVETWLETLHSAFLLGMGGAGASAAMKWTDVFRQEDREKYVVANGDESEPATFKDRELMLHFPELVVEGVILAGLITGATRGYIYVRHEYSEQIERLRGAIEDAEREGVCGSRIGETDRSFPVEVYVSPGGYICGEQSALIEAMEDRRAQPRNRPPELKTNGLFDKPTLVNNVETLAWAPAIFLESERWYAMQGATAELRGRGWRLFSICGDVERPGVFELAIGATLGDLIDGAGGVKGGNDRLLAVATSGPSGGFIPARIPIARPADLAKRVGEAVKTAESESARDRYKDSLLAGRILEFARRHLPDGTASLDARLLPLDLNLFRSLSRVLGLRGGLMLGAGLAVYATGADMLDQAVNATEFFANESCGKCVPCRIGSEKLAQVGRRMLRERDGDPAEIMPSDDLFLLHNVLVATSICGLGPSAGKPLTSWLEFRAEF